MLSSLLMELSLAVMARWEGKNAPTGVRGVLLPPLGRSRAGTDRGRRSGGGLTSTLSLALASTPARRSRVRLDGGGWLEWYCGWDGSSCWGRALSRVRPCLSSSKDPALSRRWREDWLPRRDDWLPSERGERYGWPPLANAVRSPDRRRSSRGEGRRRRELGEYLRSEE